jgi:hypothetical protein
MTYIVSAASELINSPSRGSILNSRGTSAVVDRFDPQSPYLLRKTTQ